MQENTRTPEHITIDETELDIIHKYIKDASQLYQYSKTPEEGRVEKIANELYDMLYKWRDSQTERPRNAPVKYSLIELFEDLKYGRTSEDQKLLRKFINEISGG